MSVLMSSMFFTRAKHAPTGGWTAFLATGAAVFAIFCMAPTMANVFGLDRNGFRALVLLPTRRHYILLAKNLAFFPFVAAIAVLLIILVTVLMRLPWDAVLMGLVQTPTAFLLFSLLCNLAAILAPYRMAAGSLQAKKPKAVVFLVMLVNMLLLPMVAPVLLIPPGLQLLFSSQTWVPWLPVNLISAIILLAIVGWAYRWLLPFEGRLLQRREQNILREVTEETE
jgi:hypothetical protein